MRWDFGGAATGVWGGRGVGTKHLGAWAPGGRVITVVDLERLGDRAETARVGTPDG